MYLCKRFLEGARYLRTLTSTIHLVLSRDIFNGGTFSGPPLRSIILNIELWLSIGFLKLWTTGSHWLCLCPYSTGFLCLRVRHCIFQHKFYYSPSHRFLYSSNRECLPFQAIQEYSWNFLPHCSLFITLFQHQFPHHFYLQPPAEPPYYHIPGSQWLFFLFSIFNYLP